MVVFLRGHKTETEKFIAQEGEGGAVADHQPLSDAAVEKKIRVCVLPKNFHQNKIIKSGAFSTAFLEEDLRTGFKTIILRKKISYEEI